MTIKRYKTIAKAVTVLYGGFIAVKEVMVEECDKGYLVMHTDHLAALQAARIEAVREFAEWAERIDENYRVFPITVDAENWINEQLKEQGE